jgi:hypothetical protein
VPKPPTEIGSLARSYAERAIRTLANIADKSSDHGARVRAASTLLDRGSGKPKQVHQHGGAEGEGAIIVKVIYDKDD